MLLYIFVLVGIPFGALSANALLRGRHSAAKVWLAFAGLTGAVDYLLYGLSTAALTAALALLGAILSGILTFTVREWGNLA